MLIQLQETITQVKVAISSSTQKFPELLPNQSPQ